MINGMPMPDRHFKCDDTLWHAAGTEARHLGMSRAEFMRGATAARIGYSAAARGAEDGRLFGELFAAGDAFARAFWDGDTPTREG